MSCYFCDLDDPMPMWFLTGTWLYNRMRTYVARLPIGDQRITIMWFAQCSQWNCDPCSYVCSPPSSFIKGMIIFIPTYACVHTTADSKFKRVIVHQVSLVPEQTCCVRDRIPGLTMFLSIISTADPSHTKKTKALKAPGVGCLPIFPTCGSERTWALSPT